jgi:hydroxypyruvate reductase
LLPAPIEGLSLQSKIELTQEIAARGGNIHELNTMRRELSRIKGGGLARACRAGQLVSLILSDVLGDDLSVIASGPTVHSESTPELAIEVLHKFQLQDHPAGSEAIRLLREARALNHAEPGSHCQVTNIIIGNNATAVDAAGIEAERLGYSHAMISARGPEGSAEDVAAKLVEMAVTMREESEPDCLISGGEPTVILCDAAERGRGGRNQQLALAALDKLDDWRSLALVSGGTDGEDGPTDAAGAFVDQQIAEQSQRLQLGPQQFLRRNDAYHFFDQVGGLIKTGPTHTNVCDLRVICCG